MLGCRFLPAGKHNDGDIAYLRMGPILLHQSQAVHVGHGLALIPWKLLDGPVEPLDDFFRNMQTEHEMHRLSGSFAYF